MGEGVLTPQPAPAAIGRFIVALALGGALWLWLRGPLAGVFAVLLDIALAAFGGAAFDAATVSGDQIILQTRLLTPDGASLLLGRVEPAHFTLAVPLVWAGVVAIAPPRACIRWLPLATIIALGFCLLAVLLQAGVAIPRLGVRSGSVALQGGTPLQPFVAPWSPPNADLLSVIDAVRITLVHFNLFVLPPILAVLAARPSAAPSKPRKTARTSSSKRHDRRHPRAR